MKTCPKCSEEFDDKQTLCPNDGEVLTKGSDELVGQTLAGKYRVEEFMSEGGMARVYRGTHILMDKKVAIKVLHPSLAADENIVRRFSREAKAASRISHPHALSVTDFGETESGNVFLVMEYLKGRTLKEVIRSTGPLPLSRVVEIMRQVSGALEAAHAENVIHRDLKSDNIMLVDMGTGTDWVKVLDFGIAKILEPASKDPDLTSPNLIIGTPQYMSPEQCSHSPEIDSRSDIYSLGVILFELLTGHVPFVGESPTAVMLMHLQEPAPDVREERSDLPVEVAHVVGRALAKSPANRFSSAGELAESLAVAAMLNSGERPAPANFSGEFAPRMNRIVVPLGEQEIAHARSPSHDDEITIVNPPMVATEVRQSSAGSWRVAIVAFIGVLVIGGILYAFTSMRRPANEPQTPPLTADPNSQPVKPAKPPTGHSETGISTNPSNTNDSLNLNSNTGVSPPSDGNTNSEIPPPLDTNANSGANTNRPGTDGSASPNANANQNKNNPPAQQTPKVDVGEPPPASTPPPNKPDQRY